MTETTVEVGVSQEPPKFVGLGKDELLKVANTPFWIRTRWALFILFWAAWLGLLAGAIVLIVNAPKSDNDFTGTTPLWTTETTEIAAGKLVQLALNLES